MRTSWILAIALLFPSIICAGDWPQWRGPNRDGVAIDAKLPETWPANPKPLWRISLGDGYSAPVIVGDRLYTHARDGGNETIYCFHANTGKEIWRQSYPAPYEMHPAATGHGLGPKSTTTVVDGRVYAFGITSILTCLDAETGKVIWQHDLKEQYEAQPAEYGTAGSPLIEGSMVIVPVGGKQGGSVMAFHTRDGSLVWKAVPGELPAMSSPIAADLAGTRHILTFTEKRFVGLHAADGAVLWEYPFETSYRQNIVTPVVVDDLVIASGISRFAFALRVTKDGDAVKATEVWKNRDLRCYMSSPVVVDDHIYGLGGKNAFACVNVRTGDTAWTQSAEFGEYCTIVAADNRLLVLDTSGMLTVLKADPSAYQVVGKSKVSDGAAWSHLAIVGSRIYVRDRKQLACFDLMSTARR